MVKEEEQELYTYDCDNFITTKIYIVCLCK